MDGKTMNHSHKKSLRHYIAEAKKDPRFTSGIVDYCYHAYTYVQPEMGDVANQVKIKDLTEEQLEERWNESEVWVESGDLCLCKGR